MNQLHGLGSLPFSGYICWVQFSTAIPMFGGGLCYRHRDIFFFLSSQRNAGLGTSKQSAGCFGSIEPIHTINHLIPHIRDHYSLVRVLDINS
jgi:hypothetical protein